MTLILTYECPDCGKITQSLKHEVKRHKGCKQDETGPLYVLKEVKVEP